IRQNRALGSVNNGTVVNTGAGLQLDGSGAPLNVTGETLTLNGPGFNAGGALENLLGNNIWGGPIIDASTASSGVDSGATLPVPGGVQDGVPAPVPAASLAKVGTGTLVFPNANPFTGTTFVNAGVLNVQNAGSLGAAVNNVQRVSVTGPVTGTFRLTFNGQQTSALANNASAAAVQSALEALSTIGVGNVSVTGATTGTAAIVAAPTGAVEVGNTVTITTAVAHNFTVGQTVQVSGVGVAGY